MHFSGLFKKRKTKTKNLQIVVQNKNKTLWEICLFCTFLIYSKILCNAYYKAKNFPLKVSKGMQPCRSKKKATHNINLHDNERVKGSINRFGFFTKSADFFLISCCQQRAFYTHVIILVECRLGSIAREEI